MSKAEAILEKCVRPAKMYGRLRLVVVWDKDKGAERCWLLCPKEMGRRPLKSGACGQWLFIMETRKDPWTRYNLDSSARCSVYFSLCKVASVVDYLNLNPILTSLMESRNNGA